MEEQSSRGGAAEKRGCGALGERLRSPICIDPVHGLVAFQPTSVVDAVDGYGVWTRCTQEVVEEEGLRDSNFVLCRRGGTVEVFEEVPKWGARADLDPWGPTCQFHITCLLMAKHAYIHTPE